MIVTGSATARRCTLCRPTRNSVNCAGPIRIERNGDNAMQKLFQHQVHFLKQNPSRSALIWTRLGLWYKMYLCQKGLLPLARAKFAELSSREETVPGARQLFARNAVISYLRPIRIGRLELGKSLGSSISLGFGARGRSDISRSMDDISIALSWRKSWAGSCLQMKLCIISITTNTIIIPIISN